MVLISLQRGIVESKVNLWRVRDMRTTSASESAILHNQEVIYSDIEKLRQEMQAMKISVPEKKDIATGDITIEPVTTEEG
jgi:hypothetical protein